MDNQPRLQHSKIGSDTLRLDQLLFDPNSNFDELIPVDDFFSDYISQLEAAGGDGPQPAAAAQDHSGPSSLSQLQMAQLQAQYLQHQQQQQQQQQQMQQQAQPGQGPGGHLLPPDTNVLMRDTSNASFLAGLPSGDYSNMGSGNFGGLGDLNGLGRLPTLPGPDLNLPDLNAPDLADMQALQGFDPSLLGSHAPLRGGSLQSSGSMSSAQHSVGADGVPTLRATSVRHLQAQDGLMQYGAFGGMSPYAMVADGASIRASSAPAYDLTPAHPQYHPPVITGGDSYQRQARGPSPHGGQQPVPSNMAPVAGEAPQVVIVNQHLRQPPPQQHQTQPPPQLVIARPRADGASPPDSRSPQFPAIPPFAGASPLETPATSGQSQPQLRYHKQGQQPVGTATALLQKPPVVGEANSRPTSNTFARLTQDLGGGPGSGGGSGELLSAGSGDPNGGDMVYSGGDDDGDMDMDAEGGGSKNRRHRTLRQQMLNKQAQQRYRERKKAKAQDLEKTVAALSEQLQSMAGVKQENSELQDRNLALVNRLRSKEEELERMLREQAAQPAYMKTGSGRVVELAGTDEAETSVKEVESLSNTYQATVAELRALLVKYRLENGSGADIAGSTAPPETLKHMSSLVETVNTVHSKVLRMEGNHASKFVSPSVDRSSGRHDVSRRWVQAAQLMRFTKEQEDKILSVRAEHLRRLQRIYEERRVVNLEAISVLLPQERGGTAPSTAPMEKAKSWLPSMFQRSKHAAKQKEVMKKLKNNLSEEQRLASELDYLVFRRILTPVQGAWFILHKYPAYCDSLSLCNGVAEMAGVLQQGEQ